jgi:hypothetical protein
MEHAPEDAGTFILGVLGNGYWLGVVVKFASPYTYL